MKEQLEILCNIYGLFLLHKHLGDFLKTGCISPKQASLANDQLRSLYSQVCPKQFSLVNGLLMPKNICLLITKFDSWILRSVLMWSPLWMPSITRTTSLARFLGDMMVMCIQNSMRRHGRILWMSQLCLTAIRNISCLCWSNSYVMQDFEEYLINYADASIHLEISSLYNC